jgi:hypothetical protein
MVYRFCGRVPQRIIGRYDPITRVELLKSGVDVLNWRLDFYLKLYRASTLFYSSIFAIIELS